METLREPITPKYNTDIEIGDVIEHQYQVNFTPYTHYGVVIKESPYFFEIFWMPPTESFSNFLHKIDYKRTWFKI